MRAYQIARLGISRTFQTPILIPRLSVVENVIVGYEQRDGCGVFASVFRLPKGRRADAAARVTARAALEEVGLGAIAERPSHELTHGQQRLTELTRVLVSNPGLVLLDEPAAGLSVSELEGLEHVLRTMCNHGTGVLLVEHNVPFVLGIAEEVTVLHQGRVIVNGPADVVESHPDVIESFLGRLAVAPSSKVQGG
jgi:ABC-type branched-subunit amino acid transport system ATPase component